MRIVLSSIRHVCNEDKNKKDNDWGEDVSKIILEEKYFGGLNGLNDFSHVIIIYYLDKAMFDIEKHLQRRPQNREDMPSAGIFS